MSEGEAERMAGMFWTVFLTLIVFFSLLACLVGWLIKRDRPL
jgi:hypothetical protein